MALLAKNFMPRANRAIGLGACQWCRAVAGLDGRNGSWRGRLRKQGFPANFQETRMGLSCPPRTNEPSAVRFDGTPGSFSY